MEHISSWSMLTIPIDTMKTIKNTEALVEASREVDIEVSSEET
jgi:hypothetical protein